MIFQTPNSIEKIVRGEKTQTRRIVKPDDAYSPTTLIVYGQGYNAQTATFYDIPRFVVGKDYAVQPGRGKPTVWYHAVRTTLGVHYHILNPDGEDALFHEMHAQPLRIRITAIRGEDVRQISEADARAEGYHDIHDFWDTWIGMHDRSFQAKYRYAADCEYLREYGFYDRPAERYQAWALTFEVVK